MPRRVKQFLGVGKQKEMRHVEFFQSSLSKNDQLNLCIAMKSCKARRMSAS